MSRIGKLPVVIPEKVKLEPRPGEVEVSGPLGKMTQKLPPGICVKLEAGKAIVETSGDRDDAAALHGLSRTLVYNAVFGVSRGFKRELEIVGLGYRASVSGDKLMLTLGYAHPIQFKIPAGLKVSIDPKQTLLTISGVDANLVGEAAARIRKLKPPEPYKGSGVKYVGEHIIRKAGKAAAGAVGGGKK